MTSPDGWVGRTAHVATAGVILRHGGRFVFQTGLNGAGDALGVVRLGGHVESGESPEVCAVREVEEEAAVRCELEPAPDTYSYWSGDLRPPLASTEWPEPGPTPLLIGWVEGDLGVAELSVTYLATTEEPPRPSCETQALLFLSSADVSQLVVEAVTLDAFLDRGGQAIIAADLPPELTFRPHQQLVALATLLAAGAI